jgi:hypothetical protein
VPFTEERLEDLELLAGEVIANAVGHTQAPCSVAVRWTGVRVRVEVADSSAVRPKPRSSSPDAEDGRGLLLVDALAADWGSFYDPAGKVWSGSRSRPVSGPHGGSSRRRGVLRGRGRSRRQTVPSRLGICRPGPRTTPPRSACRRRSCRKGWPRSTIAPSSKDRCRPSPLRTCGAQAGGRGGRTQESASRLCALVPRRGHTEHIPLPELVLPHL